MYYEKSDLILKEKSGFRMEQRTLDSAPARLKGGGGKCFEEDDQNTCRKPI